MTRNVMMPTIVQRPKIFDVLEIPSSTSLDMCCWLEMEFKILYLMPKLHSAIHGDEHEAGFTRCPTPGPVCIPTKRSSAAGFESIGDTFPKGILLNSRGLGVSHRAAHT